MATLQNWFLSEGYLARKGYLTSVTQLENNMPELVPTYHQLLQLAGGGDLGSKVSHYVLPTGIYVSMFTGCLD